MIDGIVVISGVRNSGTSSLIPHVIEGLRLERPCAEFDHSNKHLLGEKLNEIMESTVATNTVVLDCGSYSSDFFDDKKEYLFNARFYKSTIIITTQSRGALPIWLRANVNVLFELFLSDENQRFCDVSYMDTSREIQLHGNSYTELVEYLRTL